MEFDKSKVFTYDSADKIKPGSEGYFADSLDDLHRIVLSDDRGWFSQISEIADSIFEERFITADEISFPYFYLVKGA